MAAYDAELHGGDVGGGGGGGGGREAAGLLRDGLCESPANFLFIALLVGLGASDKLVYKWLRIRRVTV